MTDTLTLDIVDLEPAQIVEILERVRAYRSQNDQAVVDDESWRDAESTGWTKEHVELLRIHLEQRQKNVQLEAFDLAIKNGGFVSREQVYAIGGYQPTRKLNNWTAPINNFSQALVDHHGLPEDAAWPIETEYGHGNGFRPAIGFSVAPEIVKLMRG